MRQCGFGDAFLDAMHAQRANKLSELNFVTRCSYKSECVKVKDREFAL